MCSIPRTFFRKSWHSDCWRTWRGVTTHFQTERFRWTAQPRLRVAWQNSCRKELMHSLAEQGPKIGYVVSTWPRLSQTFVLNEILALERCGLSLRIFSTKAPRAEPDNDKVAQLRAHVSYLNFRGCRRAILLANVRIARALPGRYFQAMIRALRYGRLGILWRFFQAGYL